MKKILPIIMISIAMSLSGCNNKDINNKDINDNINKSDTGKVTIEQAKEIALKHANLTSDKVTFGKSELDFDDGIQKYDIEFYYNNREYSFEIDANTGKVLAYEQD